MEWLVFAEESSGTVLSGEELSENSPCRKKRGAKKQMRISVHNVSQYISLHLFVHLVKHNAELSRGT